ncbi:MAG: hypothetical protein HYX80_07120 [Chloroflexi bacterium]|nr:hypothetical protein [Chloroflexota bacterium]
MIDIDNERENLDDALVATRNAVECLFSCYRLNDSNIRLFFTGHKGFNIEILPTAPGFAPMLCEQDKKANEIREVIIDELQLKAGLTSKQGRNRVSLEDTVIDGTHDYVRLHDSINMWIENAGQKARRKISLTRDELNSLSLREIIARSKA